jgi:SnoaL-like domain
MTDLDTNALRALIEKQAITEQLMRYSRAVDRHDIALFRSVYWPDADDDHLLYEGDLEGLVKFAFGFTEDMPTQHLLGNILIELADETNAYSETYYQAFHDMPTETGPRENLVLQGRYIDHFQKRQNEGGEWQWRIAHRSVALDCYTRFPATSEWQSGMFANIKTRGGFKPNDPLYKVNPLA